MLKNLSLVLIQFYQKRISPKKGFSCAYRVHARGAGCSGFGKRAIQKHGFFLGLVLLRRRLAKCAWHAHQHVALPPLALGRNRILQGQGGFVDCDIPDCDMPSCGTPSCELPACKMPCKLTSIVPSGLLEHKAVGPCISGCDCTGCDSCGKKGRSREDKRLQVIQARRKAGNEKTGI